MKTLRSLSEQSFPQLMTKLRRVGGLSILFMLLVLALVHWIAQDINRVTNDLSLSRQAMHTSVQECIARLNAVILLSGVFMVLVFFLAAQLAARFVRMHLGGLELMNRRKSQFVAMVSHELRTPLNAAGGRNCRMGLGLAFCKLPVAAQGGTIWVESELGYGTTLSFTLPMVDPVLRQPSQRQEQVLR